MLMPDVKNWVLCLMTMRREPSYAPPSEGVHALVTHTPSYLTMPGPFQETGLLCVSGQSLDTDSGIGYTRRERRGMVKE